MQPISMPLPDVPSGPERGQQPGEAGTGWPGGPHDGPPGLRSAQDTERIAAAVFTALADPTRRDILTELARRGPATATDLAMVLPISRQAIAKHLGLLSEAGLVRPQPGERRRVRFVLQSAPMGVAQSFLAALARDWDRHLADLRRYLDR